MLLSSTLRYNIEVMTRTMNDRPRQEGCGVCAGMLNPCPVCFHRAAPFSRNTGFEERLDDRRHKGTHETAFIPTGASALDDNPEPATFGLYSIDNGPDRAGPKYSRSFNSEFDGPGRGTW